MPTWRAGCLYSLAMKKQLKTSKLPLRIETVRTLTQKELSDVAGGYMQSLTAPETAKCTVSGYQVH